MSDQDWDFFLEDAEHRYESESYSDYTGFLNWLESRCENKGYEFSDWKEKFPDPSTNYIYAELEDEDVEGELWYPPDTGPLADYEDHGWIEEDDIESYMKDPVYKMMRQNQSIKEKDTLDDIFQNTMHILGRCNNPDDWGEDDKRGLVYGMIQSGKTASMINLIASGMKAGYKVFIVLAGDKNSLRVQTQDRINESFNLVNGANQSHAIHSPTFDGDFDDSDPSAQNSAFKLYHRIKNGVEYSTIFVIKKNTHIIPKLRACIESLSVSCKEHANRGFDFSEDYKCMIIDDEADYASQDTDTDNDGSVIHNKIIDLRLIEGFRNCYIAYTATPQACLSSDIEDVIGYPRDFFWVLEPYMEKNEIGEWKARSYMGAHELFNDYDYYLLKDIEDDDWPHHQRRDNGSYRGVWVPPADGHGTGRIVPNAKLNRQEENFLDLMLDENSPVSPPNSMRIALHSHIITCAVRWYRHWWKKGRRGQKTPGAAEVAESYPHHATMIHLTRFIDYQEKCALVVGNVWDQVVGDWEDLDGVPEGGSVIGNLWEEQVIRSRQIRAGNRPLKFEDVKPFFDLAIEITNAPIRQYDPQGNYPYYTDEEGRQRRFYLLNSQSGMQLLYSEKYTMHVRTKKAGIFIGGDILSRGLTVEGLSVSYFGRSAGKEMGDTVLQRARWFGHKKSYADLVQVFLQRRAQTLFRQIANADRDLRIQIKQAIRRGLGPMEVLLLLRNSSWFNSTSDRKSKFLTQGARTSFSGARAILKEPTFESRALLKNNKMLAKFEKEHEGLLDLTQDKNTRLVHNRARLYRGVPVSDVIAFFESIVCKEDAWKDSPKRYAEFLSDWRDNPNVSSSIPPINVAVMNNRMMTRKRILRDPRAATPEEARRSATGRIAALIGGANATGAYQGDYFLDKPKKWHEKQERDRIRGKDRFSGDEILIVLYGLRPNYVARQLFDPDVGDMGGYKSCDQIFLQSGDDGFVDHGDDEESHSAIVYAAFTPVGGPVYDIAFNHLVQGAGMVADDDVDDTDEENTDA